MAYIGKSPSIGSYSMLDNLTASATASYSLTLDSVAFVPESANHLIVSLNGVIQKAGSSFTVSSSTLTFSSALTSSDSIDFVLALGSVLDIGTPSDATVTKAKTNFVSSGSGYTGTGLDIKGDGSANGRLGLLCSAGSHGVALESPDHSSAQSYTIQLPSNSPTVDKVIKVTSLTGSGATAIAHTQFGDAGGQNTPFVSVDKTGSSQSISATTYTKVTLNTERVDSDSAFASNDFTVPSGKAGKYYLSCYVRIVGLNGTSDFANIQIANTNRSTTYSSVSASGNSGYGWVCLATSVIRDLSVGDTVSLYAYSSEGIDVAEDNCNLTVFKLIE